MTLQTYAGQSSNANSNEAARPTILRGASLAHRSRLSKSQRAVLAADILDGARIYQPTRTELAELFDIGTTTIDRAQRLSPDRRQMIMKIGATLAMFEQSQPGRRCRNRSSSGSPSR